MRPLPRAKELQDAWRPIFARPGTSSASRTRSSASPEVSRSILSCLISARTVRSRPALSPEFVVANYLQLLRVCRDPSSEFSRLPDTIILLCRLEDIADPGDPAKTQAARDALLGAVRGLRDVFDGTIVLGLPPRPRVRGRTGRIRKSHSVDRALVRYAVQDLISCRLASRFPHGRCRDLHRRPRRSRKYRPPHRVSLPRQPYSEAFYVDLAGAHAGSTGPAGGSRKCLVVDCDNTLWGGVIGEDGVGGVHLSDDFPGNAVNSSFRSRRCGSREFSWP